jgi:hypothetical protein
MLHKASTFRQRQVAVESERGAVFLINFLEILAAALLGGGVHVAIPYRDGRR